MCDDRKATLPVELEIGLQIKDPVMEEEMEFEGIEEKMEAMMEVKDQMSQKAKNNIGSAQERYKRDYDKKRKLEHVR